MIMFKGPTAEAPAYKRIQFFTKVYYFPYLLCFACQAFANVEHGCHEGAWCKLNVVRYHNCQKLCCFFYFFLSFFCQTP